MVQHKVNARGPYDPSQPVDVYFSQPTMAKQSFQDECDINTIMSRYEKTGLIEHVKDVQGSYGDFTSVDDYHASLNKVISAQEAFYKLPSSIRARFDNDPSHLMAFLEDPENRSEAVKLGLIDPTPSDQPKGAPEPSVEDPDVAP